MDETKLRTIAQLQEFLDATSEVKFTGTAGDGDTIGIFDVGHCRQL